MSLPEPRRYGGASVTDTLALAASRAAGADALERPRRVAELRGALAAALERGEAARIAAALRQVPNAASYRLLVAAVAGAIDGAGGVGEVVARAFALPVVLVTRTAQTAVIPGTLSDAQVLHALFERTRALGPTRNFGLSNALCALPALEALATSSVLALARAFDPRALEAALPPAPVEVSPGHEQTHLRFVVGAGLTAADSPGLAEVAAHIAPWGAECARLLQRQLAVPGVELLALPRPPLDLLGAAHAGRFAQLEVALDLFASNALRRFRLSVGEPVVIVSAHEGAEIRVTLSSPFADDLVEGFRWPLHHADDLSAVEGVVLQLFADMRVQDVRLVRCVLPACRSNGAPLYPRSEEFDRLDAGAAP
jgi:hypothetical protein